jgi:hypothetical protein
MRVRTRERGNERSSNYELNLHSKEIFNYELNLLHSGREKGNESGEERGRGVMRGVVIMNSFIQEERKEIRLRE